MRDRNDLAIAIEGEPAPGNQHPPFHGADVLPDRKRVQEFVGDEEQRLGGQVLNALVPMRIGHRRFLHLA